MQRKIFRLVATDFCTWIPISIMSFLHFNGIPMPPSLYVISAILLIPINSAINPILYSDTFDNLVLKIRHRKKFKLFSRKNIFSPSAKRATTFTTYVWFL